MYSPPSAKLVISGIPLHAHFDDIEPLLKTYGTVVHCDAVSSKDPNTQTIHITFDTHAQAQRYMLLLCLFVFLLLVVHDTQRGIEYRFYSTGVWGGRTFPQTKYTESYRHI